MEKVPSYSFIARNRLWNRMLCCQSHPEFPSYEQYRRRHCIVCSKENWQDQNLIFIDFFEAFFNKERDKYYHFFWIQLFFGEVSDDFSISWQKAETSISEQI